MPDPVIVKAGSENPDPLSGISYPIPYCLDELRKTCTVIVTEDEDEQTLIEAVPGASVLMITYGTVSHRVIEAGKTVGLVGFGHINSKLAQMCRGFEMQIQAYDPGVSAGKMESQNVRKIDSLDELAALSDVVSICTPLTPETQGLIDMGFLEKMKPQAFLINVGRGATVDEMALLEALESGQIAGCGLDVYSEEPLNNQDHPLSKLLTMDNVVVFPHLAAWTTDTWDRLQNEVLDHVMNVLHNRDLIINSTDPRLANQPGCYYAE